MSMGNEPAYPLVRPDPHGGYPYVYEGMAKREAFAMAAMQGWLANSPRVAGQQIDGTKECAEQVAAAAVTYADALLAALAANGGTQG